MMRCWRPLRRFWRWWRSNSLDDLATAQLSGIAAVATLLRHLRRRLLRRGSDENTVGAR
ncbi:MAG: hypothetical protein R2856_11955 [Caldilineaceae bacterium]